MRSVESGSAFSIEPLEGRKLFAVILPAAKATAAKPPVAPMAVGTLTMPAGTNTWFIAANAASTQLEVRIGSDTNPPAYTFSFGVYSGLYIDGNSGTDTVQLSIGSGGPPSAFALNFDGNANQNGDQLIIRGRANFANTVSFSDGDQVSIGNYGISYFDVETHTYFGSTASDTINITGNDNPRAFGFGGNDYFNVTDGVFNPGYDLKTDGSNSTLTVSGNSSVVFYADQHLSSLLIGNDSRVYLGSSADFIRTDVLAIGTTATLDLRSGYLLYNYSGDYPTAIASRVASGYANGSWTGPGIYSSTAAADTSKRRGLGTTTASAIFNISATETRNYWGETVDGSTLIVRYTYYGDTDLDLGVSIADFNRLSSKFGKAGSWSDGDFDYDNGVSIADFNKLALNFGVYYF